MKPLVNLCLITTLSLVATGCVFIDGKHVNLDDWEETQQENRERISQLNVGMHRSAVVEELGAPSDSEAFQHNGEEVRVLFYRTQRKHSDGNTSRDETTPLIFKDELLVGWGSAVYANLQH